MLPSKYLIAPSPRPDGRKTAAAACYRVWIATCGPWQPRSWHDIPRQAVAVEPAEQDAMSLAAATRYVEAFNRAARRCGQELWAIAVPVAVRYEGEPAAGERLARHHLAAKRPV
jgi:hypothetical protein